MFKTRPSQNVFDSETRPRPSKSGLETGLETKTDLEYYNTTARRVYFFVRTIAYGWFIKC